MLLSHEAILETIVSNERDMDHVSKDNISPRPERNWPRSGSNKKPPVLSRLFKYFSRNSNSST